jgi:thioester reductase-like protein
VIAEALAGKRIFLTGATGFLGTAVVERLLRRIPDAHLTLLIRPGRRSTVERRLEREILRNNAFDRLRADLGKEGFAAMAADRVQGVAGDVTTDGLDLDDAGPW